MATLLRPCPKAGSLPASWLADGERRVLGRLMSQADAVGLNLRALRTEALRTLEGGGEKPVAFNVVPHIDVFLDDGRTKEEWKMEVESRGIPGPLDLPVAATCMRKGAALNAVQIAEALVSQTGLHPRPSLPSSA